MIKDISTSLTMNSHSWWKCERNGFSQFKYPTRLFLDPHQNAHVSDRDNHRTMKWNKDAREGLVIAKGNGSENSLIQLWCMYGIFFNTFGALYETDSDNGNLDAADFGNDHVQRFDVD